jgi:hypothetical protein
MFLILEQDTRCCCVKEFTPYRQMMQVFDANEIVSCRKRMQPYDQRKPTKISRVLAYRVGKLTSVRLVTASSCGGLNHSLNLDGHIICVIKKILSLTV